MIPLENQSREVIRQKQKENKSLARFLAWVQIHTKEYVTDTQSSLENGFDEGVEHDKNVSRGTWRKGAQHRGRGCEQERKSIVPENAVYFTTLPGTALMWLKRLEAYSK